MTIRLSGMLLLLVAFASQVPAQPSDPTDPRLNPQTTIDKTTSMAEGFEAIKDLQNKLKSLGDPTVQNPGENTGEYLRRVDRILKGRALLIHYLHQNIQSVLEAKFAAEAYLREYEEWVEKTAKRLDGLPKKYKDDLEKIQKDAQDIGKDICVLASMIKDEAKDKPALQKDMERYINAELLKLTTDRTERETRFRPLTLENKQKELDLLTATVHGMAYEITLLKISVIPQSEKFRNELPKKHLEAVEGLRDVLQSNKESLLVLQYKAVQVSVIAKYAADDLQLVQPDANLTRQEIETKLKTIRTAQPLISEALKEFLNTTTKNPGAFRDGISVGDILSDLVPREVLPMTPVPPKP